MGNKILTFVIQEAENVLDSVIAAAVNEIHNLGHTVKEVRLMGDSGETKVALNTIEGVTPEAAGNAAAPAAPAEEATVVPPTTPAIAPAVETGTTGALADEPVLTDKAQREQELLDELAALRQEPDDETTETTTPPATEEAADPTSSETAEPPADPAS